MTCKYNEAVALNTDKVAKLIKENDIIAIRADKTHENPEIDKLLAELGNPGAGIPFLAFFPADGGDPITLDGPVTEQMVLDALRQASSSTGVAQPEVADANAPAGSLAR